MVSNARTAWVVAVVGLVTVLTACSGGETSDATTPTPTATETIDPASLATSNTCGELLKAAGSTDPTDIISAIATTAGVPGVDTAAAAAYCEANPTAVIGEALLTSETASATPTPEDPPGSFSLVGYVPFTDGDGYTWNLQYDFEGGYFGRYITNAKPGTVNFSSTVTANTAAITNTTAGRSTPLKAFPLAISVYDADSPACTISGWLTYTGRVGQPILASIGDGPNAGKRVCYIPRTAQLFPPTAGEEVTSQQVVKLSPDGNESRTGERYSDGSVAETDAQTYIDALNAPLATVVKLADIPYGAQSGPSICQVSDKSGGSGTIFDRSGSLCG